MSELDFDKFKVQELTKTDIENMELQLTYIIDNLKKEDEIKRLHSIIKEVREYIWSTKYEYGDIEEDNEDFDIDAYKLLSILDKVEVK